MITALAEALFGYKTTSWYITTVQITFLVAIKLVGLPPFFFFSLFRELGRQRSTIELDTPSMKPAQLQALEEAINEKIRDHVPVNVQLLSIDDPAVEKVHLSILCVMVLKHSPHTLQS